MKEFSYLMLWIPSMGKEDQFLDIIDGLYNLTANEWQRCGLKDSLTTLVIVDALI